MRDYLLFLDTEASGLPVKWNKPYTDFSNWPTAVQVSWLIYKRDGTLVKQENHYIGDDDIKIKPSATKIHGITRQHLDQYGVSRQTVMSRLAEDLASYEPMVVGHFMEFDFHIISADFCRADIQNPVKDLPVFCTMLGSTNYVQHPSVTHLRLGELYNLLFSEKLENQHDAYIDASATARCFFELLERGDITESQIDSQQANIKNPKTAGASTWFTPVLLILFVALLITLWI